MSTSSAVRYSRILSRLTRLRGEWTPMNVVFRTVYPGQTPEAVPDDPSGQTIIFTTIYEDRPTFETEHKTRSPKPERRP